ncbi:MAG: carbon-nitrogen hydrolase family protein [Planctomycetota bacterium]
MTEKRKFKVGLAQLAPVWLEREATTEKVIASIDEASDQECKLVAFGEALLPGYPFWVDFTDGAKFESDVQKEIFSRYAEQAVVIERGDLDSVCAAAKRGRCMVVLGTIERAADRGGHSLYCSLVKIDTDGQILSVHRKLMPTYEERLVWSPGDGHGLQVHSLGAFQVGALNCWENWMPLPRASLYAQGEDLHVAIWPGSVRNTEDITRFIARESRSYVLSVSGVLTAEDIPDSMPQRELILGRCPEVMANGGSCVAGPNGEWVAPPASADEQLLVAELDHQMVLRERQNFDPSGHYSRPDVTKLVVNRQRQSVLDLQD